MGTKKTSIERNKDKAKTLLHQIWQDFGDASDQPCELLLFIGLFFAALDVAAQFLAWVFHGITGLSWFCWDSVVLKRPREVVGVLVFNAALSRKDGLMYVLNQKMNVVVPLASALHVLVRRVR